jgi:hypothetical protein
MMIRIKQTAPAKKLCAKRPFKGQSHATSANALWRVSPAAPVKRVFLLFEAPSIVPADDVSNTAATSADATTTNE